MKFIIVGAGDVGISLAENLTASDQEVVLIERNESHIAKIPPTVDAQIIHGNGCLAEILIAANIQQADYFLAVADNDEVNISASLMAKLLNPKTKRIARIRHLDFNNSNISKQSLLDFFDLIINPDQAGANHLFRLLQAPGATDIIQFVNGKLHAYGIEIAKDAPCHNTQIKNLNKKIKNVPLLVIAIIRNKKLIVPHGDDYLYSGDVIYAVTPPKHTQRLFELVGQKNKETRNVMIWGGSILAKFLTTKLQSIGIKVKVILPQEQINDETIDLYQDALILDGEGTDQRILLEENVGDTDAFIAASVDEEDNVLAALLAKKLGTHQSMALVNKRTYLDLVTKIGVDNVVSTQQAAAMAISKYIHPDTVFSDSGLSDYDTGFLEITALPDLPYINAKVSDFKLPPGVLFVALVRKNEIIIPKGSDCIEEFDTIIIFSQRDELRRLEKIMDIKIEMLS